MDHHTSTQPQQAKHKSIANGDLRVDTRLMTAAMKTTTSGIRRIGIRMSIYNAAIDHRDNRATANHSRLVRIAFTKRIQTGRAVLPCITVISKVHLFQCLSEREGPVGELFCSNDGER